MYTVAQDALAAAQLHPKDVSPSLALPISVAIPVQESTSSLSLMMMTLPGNVAAWPKRGRQSIMRPDQACIQDILYRPQRLTCDHCAALAGRHHNHCMRHVHPHSVHVSHDCQPLQDARGRQELLLGRPGLHCRNRHCRARRATSEGAHIT